MSEPTNLRLLLEEYETLQPSSPKWFTVTDILIRIMADHILKSPDVQPVKDLTDE